MIKDSEVQVGDKKASNINISKSGVSHYWAGDDGEGDIGFGSFFQAIWEGKYWVLTLTFLCFSLSLIYVFNMPNIYRSESLLAPAEPQSRGFGGQLGGLAALAGVNIGAGSAGEKIVLSIEILKSKKFIGDFILRHDLLVPLMAGLKWDIDKNILILNEKIYDEKKNKWVRDASPPKNSEPSVQEAVDDFLKLLKVYQDKSNGLVKLSIDHLSPYIAQHWVSLLIKDINSEMKVRDIEDAERNIAYLQKQINETDVADVKVALFSLVEEQTKKLMLAKVRDEYVFNVIDPPVVPEKHVRPIRILIVVIFSVVGVIFGIIVALIRWGVIAERK